MTRLTAPHRWVDAHADALFGLARARLRRRSDAEDVVQETLLAALQARKSFRGDSSERTWLIGILNHKIVDLIRVTQREELSDPDEALDEFFATNGRWHKQPADFPLDEADLIENGEFWHQVDRCLDALPKRQAQVFALLSLDGNKSEEVCKQIGISTTNLWVLLHRARLQMRECLERKWFSVGDDR